MSTSQLYHNQDLKGVKYLRTSYAGGKTTYHGEISEGYIKCSKCHSHKVVRSVSSDNYSFLSATIRISCVFILKNQPEGGRVRRSDIPVLLGKDTSSDPAKQSKPLP